MTKDEYRIAIAALGLSQVGAAKLFDAGPRTSRRWALGESRIPRSVEIALLLMIRFKVTPGSLIAAAVPYAISPKDRTVVIDLPYEENK